METTPWHLDTLAAFDVETTGVDIDTDRIVTAALLEVDAEGTVLSEHSWLLDPGVEIPEPTVAIHGIDTAFAKEHGMAAGEGVDAIRQALAAVLERSTPLVVMNAPYDLSLLDRECRRHGRVPPSHKELGEPGPIFDPLVLDKHIDRYRRGRRNLSALCRHYGVVHSGAHNASADAAAAAAVTRRIGGASAALAALPPAELHRLQVRAAAAQAASLQSYLRRRNPAAVVSPGWPVIPAA